MRKLYNALSTFDRDLIRSHLTIINCSDGWYEDIVKYYYNISTNLNLVGQITVNDALSKAVTKFTKLPESLDPDSYYIINGNISADLVRFLSQHVGKSHIVILTPSRSTRLYAMAECIYEIEALTSEKTSVLALIQKKSRYNYDMPIIFDVLRNDLI